MHKDSWFNHIAKWAAAASGKPGAFALALAVVLLWAVSGPIFKFSNTWQLVINSGTTIVTFLMVFLIQNTQNRDTSAMQIKLDELIRCSKGAHNALLDLEELAVDDLEKIRATYERLAREARAELRQGKPDIDTPEIRNDNRE